MDRRFQFGLGALFRLSMLVGLLLIASKWAAMLSDPGTAVTVFVVLLLVWAPACLGW